MAPSTSINLADVPLFAGLNSRHLRRVADVMVNRDVPNGAVVVAAGDPGDAFFIIAEGSVCVRTSGRVARMHAGEFFGEMALLDGAPRSATVTADGDVRLMVVPRNEFLQLLQDEPNITIAILATLSQRVRLLQVNKGVSPLYSP